MPTIALIPTDTQAGWFGHAARLGDALAGASVFEHTLRRAASVKQVEHIVLVHPAGQDPLSELGINANDIAKPIVSHAIEGGLHDRYSARLQASRKWALTAWRGGLGGGAVFDELLPAGPLASAMQATGATAAVIVRADWCCFDVGYAEAQLELHLGAPDAMKLTFTQAPPGLGALVTDLDLITQLAENHAAFGPALTYNPKKPAIDPIGREVCVPIEASVRDCYRRFIYDTPRSMQTLRQVADFLGEDFGTADAETITAACRAAENANDAAPTLLPMHVFMELTPERPVRGPITPQHYVDFERGPMDPALARDLFAQIGNPAQGGDIAVILGGLGDAMRHPNWETLLQDARNASVFGVCAETDLHCEDNDIPKLLSAPLDALTIRLNADTNDTYVKLMESDQFPQVAEHLQQLFMGRNEHALNEDAKGLPGMPWIVPKLVKVADNLKDMESFYDRWVTVAGHAVLERFSTGNGRIDDLSPVPMIPPTGFEPGPHQTQFTILSDGTVTLSNQDWFGEQALGSANDTPLIELWQNALAVC